MIRLLFLGDIVGEPGRTAAKKVVTAMLADNAVDFVVVNGENSAHGRGITPKIAIDLLFRQTRIILQVPIPWANIIELFIRIRTIFNDIFVT